MPYGKNSQEPVAKAFMTKTHGGSGNHKQVIRSHGAVRSNGNLAGAPTNQPNTSTGSSKSGKK
jgi:hypothetical protein